RRTSARRAPPATATRTTLARPATGSARAPTGRVHAPTGRRHVALTPTASTVFARGGRRIHRTHLVDLRRAGPRDSGTNEPPRGSPSERSAPLFVHFHLLTPLLPRYCCS